MNYKDLEEAGSNSSPKRNTSTYQENNFERIVIGHPLLDLMLQKVTAKA